MYVYIYIYICICIYIYMKPNYFSFVHFCLFARLMQVGIVASLSDCSIMPNSPTGSWNLDARLQAPDCLPDSIHWPDQKTLTRLGFSESNLPGPMGMHQPVAHPGGIYRLETNKDLYDGVRYAWLVVTTPPSAPFHITSFIEKQKC